MKITFLGGADEVGASAVLIELAGRRVLVDAGIRPSPRARYGLSGDQLPDLGGIDHAGGLDAIVLTHAHIDHSGSLELVVARYPGRPVFATPATIALSRVLHHDARRIMQSRLEEEDELPLYDDVATIQLLEAFVPAAPKLPIHLGGGLLITLYHAGHVPGAAMVGLESEEGSVLVSGDIAVSPQRTVDGLKPPPLRPHVLILESTYGSRLHANRAAEERRLVDAITSVTAEGGKVLIPAFALGRAQEVLLLLGEFRRRGELSGVTVWADGMVRAICSAYGQFVEALPKALQEGEARFFDEGIRPVEHADQRNSLVWEEGPAVIVSSSGMLSGGPSVQYARALAGKPQNAILLTGYQDEESPGRRLQELFERGGGSLKLGPDKVDVQCHLGTYALSAHADEGQLVSLVEVLDPGQVFLVHGDEAARGSLATALRQRKRQVYMPRNGQSFDLTFGAPLVRKQVRGIGVGRELSVRELWLAIGDPGGGTFSAADLALAWWEDESREHEAASLIADDDVYFQPHPSWPGWYQARIREQVEQSIRRRELMAALPDLRGQLLILRDAEGAVRPARGAEIAADHFLVEGESDRHAPEELLDVIDPCEAGLDLGQVEFFAASFAVREVLPDERPRPLEDIVDQLGWPVDRLLARAGVALGLLRAGAQHTPAGYMLSEQARMAAMMEPNQAISLAREQFPPEAGLRKGGYHLGEGLITLTFDFPDHAAEQYHEAIARVEALTGWRVQVHPEVNQQALFDLVRQRLPSDWKITRGPALYRDRGQVAVTVCGGSGDLADVAASVHRETGYELLVTVAEPAASPHVAAPKDLAGPWEINAAYAEIRRSLAGSTLYRTSLKGGQIILSFVSPQVGERHQEHIEALSRRIGWDLAVNPHPNQVAILSEARALVAAAGGQIVKGPSIFVDRGEVVVQLAAPLDEQGWGRLEESFSEKTGYRLVLE